MLNTQKEFVSDLFEKALKEIGAPETTKVILEKPRQAAHGDIACTVALQCAKPMKKSPRDIATQLVAIIQKEPGADKFFKNIEIAGPGFINMTLSDEAKQSVVRAVLSQGMTFGVKPQDPEKTVLIEYVSANPTGPLHLGHARQGALGDVLTNLFRTQGWKVTREFYYNDAGVQIQKLTDSVRARAKQLLGEAVEFPEDGYQGEYIKDIAKKYLDKESFETFDGKQITGSGDVDNIENIRRYSVAYLRNEQYADLQAFGVSFDNYFLESSLYTDGKVKEAVAAIDAAGKLYEDDGALWFKSTDYGDDKDRVVKKKDGTYTYFVPDVAYHLNKFGRGFKKALNIQGTDHFGTVARVRAGIQAASSAFGFDVPKDFPSYLLHTMLHVVKDGQEVKMSKRAGTYVTLRDLVTWVGKDAARLFLVNRKSDAEFNLDIDLARSQSDENPVYYLQYAHARICSILVQATEKGYSVPAEKEATETDLSVLTSPSELTLMNALSDYPSVLQASTDELAPHTLVSYLSDLASKFHSFYNSERVLVEDEKLRNARIALLLAVRQVFRNGLAILGLSAPERLDRENKE